MSRRTIAGERRVAVARLAVLALLLAIVAAGFLARSGVPPAAAGAPGSPNIVFILTDDQALRTFRPDVMPRTFDQVVRPGTRFTQALATPPLCCPYRAGLITGQHAHNHGVTSNNPGYAQLLDTGNVLPAWLRGAGYETSLVGKYLNGTREVLGAGAAPGWDEWYAADLKSGFQDPLIADNGDFVTTQGYLTDVLTDRAVDYIDDRASEPDPFFLLLAHVAPHPNPRTTAFCSSGQPQPTASDYRAFDGPSFRKVRPPSFDEADVSDKPTRIRRLNRLTADEVKQIHNRWRCTVAALQAVDRSVGRVMDTLLQTGQLNDTVVIYGSDNGVFYGEHRINHGKGRAYDEAWRVPFAIRATAGALGGPAAGRVTELVTQQDLTATVLELADAAPCVSPAECRRLDGRSLMGLLRGDADDWPRRRVLYELWPGCPRKALGVRTARYVYAQRAPECGGGQVELYNVKADPFELENLATRRPDVAQRMLALARRQRACTGVEGRDEPVAGRPFCR